MPGVLKVKDVDRIKAESQDYFSVNEDARLPARRAYSSERRTDISAVAAGHS